MALQNKSIKTLPAQRCGESIKNRKTNNVNQRLHFKEKTLTAIGHDYEAVVTVPTCTEAVAPTCIEAGKNEGKHCSECNEILVAQEEIPAVGHDFEDATTKAPKTCKNFN